MRIPVKSKPQKEATPEIDLKQLTELIEHFRGKQGIIIPLLQQTQAIYGYLPEEGMKFISTKLNIPLSDLYGVATFYAQFRLHPVGEHVILVCHGTACHVNGAAAITESLEEELGIQSGCTTKDNKFTLEKVACLGCCALAPVAMVGEDTYGRLDRASAKAFLKNY